METNQTKSSDLSFLEIIILVLDEKQNPSMNAAIKE